jgi:formyltetrahydrofolate hydrolase
MWNTIYIMLELFYNPRVPIQQLKPVLDLNSCIDQANNRDPYSLSNMMFLNWMIDNLRHTPIQKPLLLDKNYRVITGDTRLMALSFYPEVQHVPVLMNSSHAPANWLLIKDQTALAALLNLAVEDIITNWDWHDKQLDWIEFAYQHTSNHPHDQDQRQKRILRYLEQYPDTVFSYEWLSVPVDWSKFDNL